MVLLPLSYVPRVLTADLRDVHVPPKRAEVSLLGLRRRKNVHRQLPENSKSDCTIVHGRLLPHDRREVRRTIWQGDIHGRAEIDRERQVDPEDEQGPEDCQEVHCEDHCSSYT